MTAEERVGLWIEEGKAASLAMSKRDRIQVLQLFACYFHSGFGSRGYRLQCTCRRWLQRRDIPLLHTLEQATPLQGVLYVCLIQLYGHRL